MVVLAQLREEFEFGHVLGKVFLTENNTYTVVVLVLLYKEAEVSEFYAENFTIQSDAELALHLQFARLYALASGLSAS